MSKLLGSIFVAASAVGFGSMALCANIAYGDGMNTYSVLALRFLIGAAVLGLFALFRGFILPGRTALLVCMVMGISYATMAWSYFTALHYIASSTVALILYCYPLIVLAIAVSLNIDRIGTVGLVATIVVITGLGLLLWGDVELDWRGVSLAFAAAALYALYILIGTRLKNETDPYISSFIITLIAGLASGVGALVHGVTLPATHMGWEAILCLATIGTAIAIAAFIKGLTVIGPTLAAVLSTLEPVVTVLLAVSFLHETLSGRGLVGALLVLSAAGALCIRSGNDASPRDLCERQNPNSIHG
ncbi:DMT family transporter [Paraburkholderia bryophila]|uniref:DMT family transporter n=1 Tax=Paraburkholderia bryophila TaxID=420952 RepID=UPI00234903D4|nr:DMT family transporter [Paraburkholderia bryophila]WCM23149.1 DMT family transporter [Paraburkholderia bryophila]